MHEGTSIVAGASFLGMWIVMMVPMMAPSLIPALWRYAHAVRTTGETRAGGVTALVGIGYFLVWTLLGIVVFALSVVLSSIEMAEPALTRAVPFTVGGVLLAAGAFQHTAWKARQLTLCREVPHGGHALAVVGAAWRYGVCLGLHCARSCAGFTAIALVLGMMDLRVMIVVTAAITAERVAPAGVRVARVVGVVAMVAGVYLIATAGRNV